MSSNPNFGDLLVLAVWTGSTVMFFSSPPPGEIGGSISSEPYKVINPPFVLVVWKLKLSPLVLYSAKYWLCFLVCVSFQYNYNTGISYETLGPDEVRSLLTTVSNSLERTQACFHSLFLIYSFIHHIYCPPVLMKQMFIIKVVFVSTAMWGDLRTHQEDVYQVITV